MTTYKHPPTFEGKDYSQWKLEDELCQMFTAMNKTRQGIAQFVVMNGLQFRLDPLSFENSKSVKKKSHVLFKFGDGIIINSYQTVTFPAKIDSCLCNIKTKVVKCKIPLLLSQESLTKSSD